MAERARQALKADPPDWMSAEELVRKVGDGRVQVVCRL